jgi:hypothetical protein
MSTTTAAGGPLERPGATPLAGLAPRASWPRSTLLVLVGMAVLAGAWLLPPVLAPSFSSPVDAQWGPSADGVVVGQVDVHVEAWPWATLTGVDDVAGARVVGFEVRDPASGAGLGRRLGSSDEVTVVVHWQVTDCALLRKGVEPTARLRTAIGTTVLRPLPAIAGPALDLGSLRDASVCPVPRI